MQQRRSILGKTKRLLLDTDTDTNYKLQARSLYQNNSPMQIVNKNRQQQQMDRNLI